VASSSGIVRDAGRARPRRGGAAPPRRATSPHTGAGRRAFPASLSGVHRIVSCTDAAAVHAAILHRNRNEGGIPDGSQGGLRVHHPGRRDEFVRLFESLVERHFDSMRAAGCHIHVVVDDPDRAVEISEWESAETRERMMQSEAMGAFAPVRAAGRSTPCDGGRALALDPSCRAWLHHGGEPPAANASSTTISTQPSELHHQGTFPNARTAECTCGLAG
jgi:quinol monooxygenase YgiN